MVRWVSVAVNKVKIVSAITFIISHIENDILRILVIKNGNRGAVFKKSKTSKIRLFCSLFWLLTPTLKKQAKL